MRLKNVQAQYFNILWSSEAIWRHWPKCLLTPSHYHNQCSIAPLGTKFSQIWIKTQTFSLKKMGLQMSSAQWWLFYLNPKCIYLARILSVEKFGRYARLLHHLPALLVYFGPWWAGCSWPRRVWVTPGPGAALLTTTSTPCWPPPTPILLRCFVISLG